MSQVYRCYIRRIHSYEKFNSPNPNPKKEKEGGKNQAYTKTKKPEEENNRKQNEKVQKRYKHIVYFNVSWAESCVKSTYLHQHFITNTIVFLSLMHISNKVLTLCSLTLLWAALITFVGSVGDSGLQASLLVDISPWSEIMSSSCFVHDITFQACNYLF